MAHRNAFDGKAEGWRFTGCFDRLFADPGEGLHRQKYTFGGVVEQHGFHNGRGSWGSQPGGDWLPAYRAKVRRYRERKWRWLKLDAAVAIEEGWGPAQDQATSG